MIAETGNLNRSKNNHISMMQHPNDTAGQFWGCNITQLNSVTVYSCTEDVVRLCYTLGGFFFLPWFESSCPSQRKMSLTIKRKCNFYNKRLLFNIISHGLHSYQIYTHVNSCELVVAIAIIKTPKAGLFPIRMGGHYPYQ